MSFFILNLDCHTSIEGWGVRKKEEKQEKERKIETKKRERKRERR